MRIEGKFEEALFVFREIVEGLYDSYSSNNEKYREEALKKIDEIELEKRSRYACIFPDINIMPADVFNELNKMDVPIGKILFELNKDIEKCESENNCKLFKIFQQLLGKDMNIMFIFKSRENNSIITKTLKRSEKPHRHVELKEYF